MTDEEKNAMLELNRYIYGKKLSKDDIVDYISMLFGTISKLQKDNEKKNKMIDEMAKEFKEKTLMHSDKSIEQIIELFENKVSK